MAIKNISTRVQICGRSPNCHGGHSAVEQSSYISRTTMHCEYDGCTYYPKYSEDLVHCEVMLAKNAPEEYKDPAILWNAVEMNEKGSNAQLARTYRVELPNEWSYELATEVMRDYVQRNFVSKGMCVQFAIHDSENKKTGQRNLHCHLLLTMRGLDEQGHFLPKQKKVYLTDENGERIPIIDKETGQQKVDRQNRRQWKYTTVPTNDWSSKENAKLWRKDLTDTINAVNQRLGMTKDFWEHRSFQEQGLDLIPQIHLGEKASAMERAGKRSNRGDVNRDIIARNLLIETARAAYEQAKEAYEAIKAVPVSVAQTIKNEILEMIRAIAKRNQDRMRLPIVGGKYVRLVSDRAGLQAKANMEGFVNRMGWNAFEQMAAFKEDKETVFKELKDRRTELRDRMKYLETLLEAYRQYEPYIKFHKECWALKGWARKQYERKHISELAYFDSYRDRLKGMIREEDKSIHFTKWEKELDELRLEYNETQKPYAEVVNMLAHIEVLQHNRRELQRMMENEEHRQVHPTKSRCI